MIRNNQNRRRRGGGGPRPQQLAGGNNYGNRLDNRQRGNASQLLEKYRALSRDATQAGDRVTAEYYAQYAEHYYRLLGDHRDRNGEPLRRLRDEDEGFEAVAGDDAADEFAEAEPRREDARREDGRNWRADRNRETRRDEPRRDEPRRDEAQREDGRRDDSRGESRRRDWNRDREERRREPPADISAEDAEGPIPGLPGPATLTIAPPASTLDDGSSVSGGEMSEAVVAASEAEEAPAPRRRGRPRKVSA